MGMPENFLKGKPTCPKCNVNPKDGSQSYCLECRKNWSRQYRETPSYQKLAIRSKAKRFGMTYEEVIELFEKQNKSCAICNKEQPLLSHSGYDTLHIDHCHATGKSRGLLCTHCNTALGKFRDDPVRLRTAADYIERHK